MIVTKYFIYRVKKSTENGDEAEDDFLETDEGASVWLEELGLDKKSFPSLDPHRVKLYPFYIIHI